MPTPMPRKLTIQCRNYQRSNRQYYCRQLCNYSYFIKSVGEKVLRYPTIVPKTVTYYEYEFFGRRELNEPLFNNDIVENDDDIDLNNESDVLMVSDDELR
ncbi:BEM_collapsed_G0016620.mRNA.1.CDS.1 [Saccharomyces cerevisiae]|nr:BEM_collapsed_G0016620.mRNA.1.CDS.1 [Saccharomyces cerevisiae]